MTIELQYLVFAAILNGCLWIPVVIGYVKSRGLLRPEDYIVAPDSKLPAWVERANRMHQNSVENFSSFAAVVLVSAVIQYSSTITVYCAVFFFFSRLLHAIIHISGFQYFRARTVIFTISWLAFIIYAFELLFNA